MKLSTFLKNLLVEARTRADKENVKLVSVLDQLEKYVMPEGKEKYFVHFTNLNKLGIKTKSGYDMTPIGVYGYQLNSTVMNQLRTNTIPYRGEAKYLILFEWVGNPKRMLRIPTPGITQQEYESLLEKIYNKESPFALSKESEEDIAAQLKKWEKSAKSPKPTSKFWNIAWNLSGKDRVKSNKALQYFGYDSIIDDGTKTIYWEEPMQAVFLVPKVIRIIESFDNPLIKKERTNKLTENGEFTPKGWVITGDLDLSFLKLKKLPRIYSVTGNFDCSSNLLTSLNGCPQIIKGDFNCSGNKLIRLDGGPQTVGGDFDCYYNMLTSLKGCPQTVGGYFNCAHNNLTSLEDGPQTVGGTFNCSNNAESREELKETAPQYFKE